MKVGLKRILSTLLKAFVLILVSNIIIPAIAGNPISTDENQTENSYSTTADCWCDLRWSGDGVWPTKQTYSQNENIEFYMQFKNYAQDCSYIIDFQLYHPSGELMDCYYYSEYGDIEIDTINKSSVIFIPDPDTGWDLGDYKYCSKIAPDVCDGRTIEKCCTLKVITGEENWEDEWMGLDSDEGAVVTTGELQRAIYHWLNNIPVREHTMSPEDLRKIITEWISE